MKHSKPPYKETAMLTVLRLKWEELTLEITTLLDKVTRDYKFDKIIAIPRGGYLTGMLASYRFDKPLLLPNDLPDHLIDKVNSYLVVDDLCDTGRTLVDFTSYWRDRIQMRTAVTYLKPHSVFKPDYHIFEVPNTTWIQFPYEKEVCSAQSEIDAHLKKSMKDSKDFKEPYMEYI